MSKATNATPAPSPSPMIGKNKPADWVFVFKFNGYNFNGYCDPVGSEGIFGGTVQKHEYEGQWLPGQQYCFASSENKAMQLGEGKCGATHDDPIGATFAQVYDTDDYYYLIWNDQFYGSPQLPSISTPNAFAPWGHSKGMLAWNDAGEGMVLQVTTPSWPAAGSKNNPRQNDGNTLGCTNDDNCMVSQHFFGLKLTKDDVVKVLKACSNSSIATDPSNISIVKNGGPDAIKKLVNELGVLSSSTEVLDLTLSSGMRLISKPSNLYTPPWQMISHQLNNIPLRVASWWSTPPIPTTDDSTPLNCWLDSTKNNPAGNKNEPGTSGAVEIAITGSFGEHKLGLTGGEHRDCNHAKLGVSTDPDQPLSIFGDMNQQGTLHPFKDPHTGIMTCASSQNARGGMFFVMNDIEMFNSMSSLLHGETSPLGNTKVPTPPGN